ncbi:MAG: MBL fold metallo-hydrolase [Planctomycetaceae bacterium]|nr:MBL fold metallo-hydrolase [Planctomycetaceae bacterium]
MRVISLQSGSNGNCIYVEAESVNLLFDAGISGSRAKERLARHGRDIANVDAVLISHDHVDHARSMGIFHRKFRLPIYATAKTYAAASRYGLGEIAELRHFAAGERLRFGPVTVETVATPHDGVDGVVFVVDDGCHRLGILTDLGHVFDGLESIVDSLDAVLLESNYDADMLARGPYPPFLKERIKGPGGHISNVEAAALLRRKASERMQWACLAHLSADNNTPTLALKTHRQVVGPRLPIFVALRDEATDVMQVQ